MVGRQVGHYQLLEQLGAGGMGEIYKAQDGRLQRFVAIKVLSAEKAGNADIRRRFLQEAQAASALNHPNIITIHDILAEGDTDFMVLEHVQGRTLVEVLAQGALPAAQVINYGVQVADALSAAHAAGIVHRDLKPGNVMVTDAGRVKVLDFGLAKLTFGGPLGETGPDASTAVSPPLTMEGSVLGTINYMSPEQAEGKRVDGRSDIFSFGLLLYEMMTGRRGFDSDSALSTLTAILRDEVRPIPEFVPNAPPKLEQLIHRCLRKRPDDRWQSMQEVHAQLAAMKAESDSTILLGAQPALSQNAAVRPAPAAPRPAAAASAKSSKGILVAAGVVAAMLVLAAGGVGVWLYLSKRGAQPEPEPVVAVVQPPPAVAPPPVTPGPDTPPPVGSPAPPVASVPGAPPATKARATGAPQAGAPAPAITPPVATPGVEVPPTPAPAPAPAPAVALRTVALADATPIRILLNHDIPAEAAAGTALHFTVAQDILAGTTVAIAKGATVVGEIVDPGKKRLIGGSKMTFRLSQAIAVDGRRISVRATPRKRDERNARPVETPVKPKSKDVAAAAGAEYLAYIDGEQTVSVGN